MRTFELDSEYELHIDIYQMIKYLNNFLSIPQIAAIIPPIVGGGGKEKLTATRWYRT